MGDRPIGDNAPEPHRNHDVALCLGGTDDIMTPLILAPNVDVIFMVGHFAEEDIDVMIKTLQDGKREVTWKDDFVRNFVHAPILEKTPIHYLPKGKADILMYAPFPKRPTAMNWSKRLRFRYGGKERVVFVFLQSPFEKWPSCVTNLSHIFILSPLMHVTVLQKIFDVDHYAFCMSTCGGRARKTTIYAGYRTNSCNHYVVVKNGCRPRGNILGYFTLTLATPVGWALKRCLSDKERMCEFRVLDTGRVYRLKWQSWNLT
jgi:hypothetical protein